MVSRLVGSSFCAALAAQFMSLAFYNREDPVGSGTNSMEIPTAAGATPEVISIADNHTSGSTFSSFPTVVTFSALSDLLNFLPPDILLRVVFFGLGLFTNILMLKLFLEANADSESSVQVGGMALGLNFLFSELFENGRKIAGREWETINNIVAAEGSKIPNSTGKVNSTGNMNSTGSVTTGSDLMHNVPYVLFDRISGIVSNSTSAAVEGAQEVWRSVEKREDGSILGYIFDDVISKMPAQRLRFYAGVVLIILGVSCLGRGSGGNAGENSLRNNSSGKNPELEEAGKGATERKKMQ
jgi:hypothetical protein